MLSVKQRQQYLKALGFYKGNVDGLVGKLTKEAYLALQKKYFTRAKDIDGIYGNNTDILLQNAYNVSVYCKNFKLEEFRCRCGEHCTGYPVVIDIQLLKNLQALRDKFGATTITSGLRCQRHNANVGGSSGSRHKLGKAADIYNDKTRSESGRGAVMDFWRGLPKQRYTYCNIGGNYPSMGNSVHVDIR